MREISDLQPCTWFEVWVFSKVKLQWQHSSKYDMLNVTLKNATIRLQFHCITSFSFSAVA